MTRRHRIIVDDEKGIDELTPLYELLTNELSQVCFENRGNRFASIAHQNLFRLWWRLSRIDLLGKGKVGFPGYPEELTYGTIKGYVVPASWSNGIRVPGQPQANGKSFDTTNLNPPVAGATINEEAS